MPRNSQQPSTTLLLPRLSGWAAQLTDGDRYPALETILARADTSPPLAGQIDLLRMKLFGLSADAGQGPEVPVAALGLLAGGAIAATDGAYHLRLEPVVLQPDISRVMLLRSGLGGFPPDYQKQAQAIVKQVLADEGLELRTADSWSISLPQHPGVQFTSLDEALGADISDCLPEGAAGRRWKRLANEIQMALHASAVNEQRRQRGEPVINGVWFWGGGQLPARAGSCAFQQVYSIDPVSSGLAHLHNVTLASLPELFAAVQANANAMARLAPGSLLVDSAIPASSPQAEALMLYPARLEAFCAAALLRLQQQGGALVLSSPEIQLRLTPAMLRRFWRRPKPLRQQLLKLHARVVPSSQAAP